MYLADPGDELHLLGGVVLEVRDDDREGRRALVVEDGHAEEALGEAVRQQLEQRPIDARPRQPFAADEAGLVRRREELEQLGLAERARLDDRVLRDLPATTRGSIERLVLQGAQPALVAQAIEDAVSRGLRSLDAGALHVHRRASIARPPPNAGVL